MKRSTKYKKIDIKAEKIYKLEKSGEIVSKINNFFNSNDLYAKRENGNILIYFRSIYYKELDKFVGRYPEMEIISRRIDNIKSYGLSNGKKIFGNYNKERKVINRKSKEKKRGKYYYAKDNEFNKKKNELPEKFKDKILNGDSLEVLKKIPNNCIDIVITSPPYNFGLNYSSSKDEYKWEKYFNELFQIFDETIRILKYGGRILINVQPLFSDYIPSHHIISNYFMKKKMIWKGEILWEKNNYNCKYTAWGSWKSPSSPYLKYTWEFIEIFCKGKLKHKGEKNHTDITAEEFKRDVVAKWSIAPEKKMNEYDHPAMFPEELVERALKLFSFQKDIVLDPFNGVGTTTAVAKRLNRKYLGIDISQKYCKAAKKRLLNSIPENSLF